MHDYRVHRMKEEAHKGYVSVLFLVVWDFVLMVIGAFGVDYQFKCGWLAGAVLMFVLLLADLVAEPHISKEILNFDRKDGKGARIFYFAFFGYLILWAIASSFLGNAFWMLIEHTSLAINLGRITPALIGVGLGFVRYIIVGYLMLHRPWLFEVLDK